MSNVSPVQLLTSGQRYPSEDCRLPGAKVDECVHRLKRVAADRYSSRMGARAQILSFCLGS